MVRPDAKAIREWTPRAQWPQLGYPPGGSPDSLELETQLAVDYVEWATGRKLDATMPPEMVTMAQKAVALRVQQQVSEDDPEVQEAVFAGQAMRGFTVTGYSETYEEPGAASKAQNDGRMINPWPALDRLLWALVTLERFSWWRAFLAGGLVPQWGLLEVDWSGANRWGGWAGNPGSPGLPGDMPGLGGDGWPDAGMWPTGSNTGSVVLVP